MLRDRLRETIIQIDENVVKLSQKHYNKITFGDPCGDVIDKVVNLKQLRNTLEREYKRTLKGCECACNIDKLISIVNRQTEKYKGSDYLKVDRSAEQDWVLKHPNCVAREYYERFCKNLCEQLNLDISVEYSQLCELGFDITSEVISCDILADISVVQNACNLGFTIEKSIEQCKIELGLLYESVPDCNLTLDAYRDLIDLGCTYDICKKMLISGLKIKTDDNGVFLETNLGKYYFKDLTFTDILSGDFETEFNKDRKAWGEKYLKDFKLNTDNLYKVLGIPAI
jgi:hypothetical protein